MKRADIEAGKIYAYDESQSRHYRYDAVLVLSTDLYMLRRQGGSSDKIELADRFHTTMKSGGNWRNDATGLLVLHLTTTGLDDLERTIALASVEGALAGIGNDGRVLADGTDDQTGNPVVLGHYALLTNQRYLHGEYAVLQAELDAAERLRNEYSERAERDRVALVAARNEQADRLDSLGLTGYHVQSYESPGAHVKIKADDLETLLELAEHAYADNIRP